MDKAKGVRKKLKNRDSGLEITMKPTCQVTSSNTGLLEVEIMPVTSIEIEIEPMFEYHERGDDSSETVEEEETDPIGVDAMQSSDTDEYILPTNDFPEITQRINPAPSEGSIVTCDECGQEFNCTRPISKNEEILCSSCNDQNRQEYSSVKIAACPICDRQFNNHIFLTAHVKSEHQQENCFTCGVCCKTFLQLSDLNVHVKLSHEVVQNVFPCKVCKKKFALQSTLTNHEKVHREKPYACGSCNYKFFHKSHLLAHERLHTGEKPFSCDVCHKQFSKKHHLAVHATVHSGEKPYACDICNKRFSQKSSVNVHKKRFVCVMQTKCYI